MSVLQTFSQLRNKALAWVDEFGDEDTTLRLMNNALTSAYQAILFEHKWNFMLWSRPVTLTVVPGTQYYSLHPEFGRPAFFFNRTQREFLEEVTPQTLKDSGADWNTDTGAALAFERAGRSPVASQPSTASFLTVTSSVAADGASQTVTVRGETADGPTEETIACDTSGTTLFTHILSVRKNGTWSGTMTLAAGAQTLLKLFATEYGRSYQQIHLLANPTAAEVIEYKFYRNPSPFAEDNDIPDIPPGFHDILVWEALLQFSTYNAMEPGAIQLYTKNRDRLFVALQQHDIEGQSLDARTHYTTYVER